MSEQKDKAPDRTALDDDEAPEVVAHEGDEEPWCIIYTCSTHADE